MGFFQVSLPTKNCQKSTQVIALIPSFIASKSAVNQRDVFSCFFFGIAYHDEMLVFCGFWSENWRICWVMRKAYLLLPWSVVEYQVRNFGCPKFIIIQDLEWFIWMAKVEVHWFHQKLNGTESQRTPDQVSCDRSLRIPRPKASHKRFHWTS